MSLGTVGIRPRRTPIPGPPGPAGQAAPDPYKADGRQRTAEPRRAWALLGMLAQPVQGRGVPRPSPCGAAAPRDVYRPPRRSQRHRDQRPTRGLPALPGRWGRQRPTPRWWGYRLLDDRCGVGVQRRGTSSGRGGRYGVSPVGARRGAPCGAVDPRGMHLTGRERRTGAVLVGHLAGLLGAPAAPSARAPAWGCCSRSTGWQTAIVAQC